jgi:acetyltransferase-like isoleucine patch superfamily enzyme
MADHPDFLDYADKLQEQTAYGSHSEWQQKSILGKFTLLLIKLGDTSFFRSISGALSDQDGGDSSEARLLSVFANLGSVILGVCVAYAIGRILQIFIGKEIVINQEVIIEEHVKLSDLKKANADNDPKRRSAREKKAKSS